MENSINFPNLILILDIITNNFPDLIGSNQNKFIINCLNSIEESFRFKKNRIHSTPIEDLAYYTLKILSLHCLSDGNKRFFTTFFMDFLKINQNTLHETWSNLETDDQVRKIIKLTADIEDSIDMGQSDELIHENIIIPWLSRFIIFIN